MSDGNEDGVLNLSEADIVESPPEGAYSDDYEDTGIADEAGENGTGEESADEGDEPEAKPRGKSVQDRIDEITAARRAAEREADDARREASDMRRRLEELERRFPKEETQKAPENEAPKAADYDLGDLDPKYIADLIDWKAEQKLAARFEELRTLSAQEQEATSMAQGYQSRVAAAGEKYPDFDDVVTQSAARGEWPCTETMGLTILNSEVGPDLAYHFATNKAEAVRIAGLHPMDQAREIGRLEAKLSTPKAPEPKPTNAPEPPKNRLRGAGGQYATSSDAAYEKALREML